jgi:hypothetical protein
MATTVTRKKLKTHDNSNKRKVFTSENKKPTKMLTFNLKTQTSITKKQLDSTNAINKKWGFALISFRSNNHYKELIGRDKHRTKGKCLRVIF